MTWQVQKVCTDINSYEITVEKQKNHWKCEQARESWKWSIAYHGSIVATGVHNDLEAAKEIALQSVPA